MKVVKPVKVPILTRIVERDRVPQLHVAAMLGFPLSQPRALLDEVSFWPAVMGALGEAGIVDEGIAKARAELLVCGSFHAGDGEPTEASYVRASFANVDKRLSVIGDRHWRDGVPTEPLPMTSMPITWSRAFGGEGFDQNPYGLGAALIERDGEQVQPLPNVEHYDGLIRKPSDKPSPAGFAPMDVMFAQRRQRAGTYDKAWFEEHFPGMPPDMDPTFFNTAPPDQWLDDFIAGDETYLLENMHPTAPRLEGHLSGLVTRAFMIQRRAGGECFVELPMRCDTLWLFPEAELAVQIFHGSRTVADDDAGDVTHLVAACEDPTSPRPADHYRHALVRRLDKDEGALNDLSDSDLMPAVESGVAPNLGETDVGRWVRSEGLLEANLRRGHEWRRAAARAEVEAEGFDPAAFGLDGALPADPEPPLDDPDATVAYIKEQRAQAERETKRLEEMKAQAEAQARQVCAEMGEDYDELLAQRERAAAGPPAFSADKHLEMLLDMLEVAREGGQPNEELEAQLSDPDYVAQLVDTEDRLRKSYLDYAHFQPSAAPMDPSDGQQARVVVGAAMDSNTSLGGRDLTGADLSGMTLTGVDFSGAFLEAVSFRGSDLSGANLDNAVLTRADLSDANLDGATLCGANLGGATLAAASFDGADLTQAVLARAKLAGAKLTHATLENVDFFECHFGDVDLSGSTLPESNVIKADLVGARFCKADLTKANFIECTLDGADFADARLEKATFVTCIGEDVRFCRAVFSHGVVVHGSRLPGADLRGAELTRANLRGTILTGARLDGATVADADLSECDLTGGSLERAELQGSLLIRTKLDRARLAGANLMDVLMSKASVRGADLRGTLLYRADMSRVVGDEETRLTGAEVGKVRFLPKAQHQPLPEPELQGGGAP